ncbi:hypothetical protein ACFLXQ_06610 [Chloroflexota bacterium]
MSGMICPECERPLKFGGHPHRGQRIHCNNCKIKLIVAGVKPLKLEAAIPANHAAKSKKETGIVEAICPQCDHILKLSRRYRQGEKTVCNVCHTKLEIVGIDPLELDVAQTIKSRHNRW